MTHSGTEVAPDVTALVVDAQAGDRQALNDLIAAHLPLIYNITGRALGGHADVDDLVQETVVRVMRGLPGLRDPDRFRSWVVSIAYRQIHRYLRERGQAVLRTPDVPPPDLPDPDSDFAERTVTELMLTGQRQELAEAARWLADGDRHLLALWWQEATGELTRGDLAAALATTPQHAAVRLQRMKARLDLARGVVRALHANPRCPDLAGLLRGWNGAVDALWRKRLIRHTGACAGCNIHRRGLVAPEDLLLGAAALPVSATLAEAVRIALEAASAATSAAVSAATASAPVTTAPAAVRSAWNFVLAQIQGFVQHKTVTVAAAVTVVAGGGFAYAVHETPLTWAPGPHPVATDRARSAGPATPGPGTAGPAAATPTPGTVTTGVTSADLYVAPDGPADGNGSLRRPYATLGKAVAVVRPGQTIALRGGTYRPTEDVIIATSGEPQRRITLSNYRNERPVIDASLLPADRWMVTHRGSHWTVQGLEVMNSRSHAYVCIACRDNVFRGLSMHHNVRSGLTLREPGTIGNQVLDSDFFNNYDPSERGRAGIGMAIKFGAGENNVIRGCRAFDNADSGFDVGHFGSPVLLEHNWAYGNGVNRWNAPGWQANADGFHLGGGSPAPSAAHVVRHNAAWDNVGHGFADGGNAGGLQLHNNTAYRNGGAGFHTVTGAPVLDGNAAIANAVPARTGRTARTGRNTWNGGDWSAAMFRSVDPTGAAGRRRPDGQLPATTFLSTGTDLGASMTPA